MVLHGASAQHPTQCPLANVLQLNTRFWPVALVRERPLRSRETRGSPVRLIGSFAEVAMTAWGRDDSSASGSFQEANLQRRLSGDESEEVSVATRSLAAFWWRL